MPESSPACMLCRYRHVEPIPSCLGSAPWHFRDRQMRARADFVFVSMCMMSIAP